MTRNEFLSILRDDLDGMVSRQVINENIAYYGDYFDEQMASGRSEADIAAELGNPSLTARTIIDANEEGTEDYVETVYTEDDNGNYEEDRSAGYGDGYGDFQFKQIELKWYHKVGIVVAIVLVLLLVLVIAGAVLTVIGPILLVLIVVYLIYSFFMRR